MKKTLISLLVVLFALVIRAFELPLEKPYDFRKRLDVVHEAGVRDPALRPEADEFEVRDGAAIAVGADAPALVVRAAEDFADFLKVSMSVEAKVEHALPAAAAVTVKVDPSVKEGYTVSVDARGAVLAAVNDRQAAQALLITERRKHRLWAGQAGTFSGAI